MGPERRAGSRALAFHVVHAASRPLTLEVRNRFTLLSSFARSVAATSQLRHVGFTIVALPGLDHGESLTKQPNGAPHIDRSLISRQDIAKLVEQRSRRDHGEVADAVLQKIAADAPRRAQERNTFPRRARLASPWHA